MLFGSIPDHIWDEAATSLLHKGVATVRLSGRFDEGETFGSTQPSQIHRKAFRSARRVLDQALHPDRHGAEDETVLDIDHNGNAGVYGEKLCCPLLPMIAPDADSAHATGFHWAGGMSRYNVQREGIVFSDENCVGCGDIDQTNPQSFHLDVHHEDDCYLRDLSGMFCSLHSIADMVLLAIERKLELPLAEHKIDQSQPISDDDGWFQRHLGPTTTASQWHMKRFVKEQKTKDEEGNDCTEDSTKTSPLMSTSLLNENGERITLPMHTDPSLISVVIHDIEEENSDERPGALGLEYYHPKEHCWIEPEAHGHSVATIFVGSVLAYLTSGQFPAAKHRVVEKESSKLQKQRMAATLFVRPQPSALLQVPLPSPWLLKRIEEEQEERRRRQREKESKNSTLSSKKLKSPSSKTPITFDAWLKRVARNYEKQRKKSKSKTKIKE